MKNNLLFVSFLFGSLTLGCGGGKEEIKAVKQESPADEILRIGQRWTTSIVSNNILSEPSPLTVRRDRATTELALGEASGVEHFALEEHGELRKGGDVECRTEIETPVKLRYGRRHGEAIVEVSRGAVSVPRRCNGSYPEPILQLPASRVVLLLDADTLRVVEPKVDRRSFIPVVD